MGLAYWILKKEPRAINPYNPDIFPDYMYAPSLITDNLNFEEIDNNTINIISEKQNEVMSPGTTNNVTIADIDKNIQTPSPMPMTDCSISENNLNNKNISKIIKKFHHCQAVHLLNLRKTNKNRSTGTQVLTKSPLIKELREKQLEKTKKELKKSKKTKSVHTQAVENVQKKN